MVDTRAESVDLDRAGAAGDALDLEGVGTGRGAERTTADDEVAAAEAGRQQAAAGAAIDAAAAASERDVVDAAVADDQGEAGAAHHCHASRDMWVAADDEGARAARDT